MENKDTLVLLFGRDENLLHELSDIGLSVRELPQEAFCDSLKKALAETDAQYFVTAGAGGGFSAGDIRSVADALRKDPSKVYAGQRTMPEKKSPAQTLYDFLSGLELADVTTTLYGLSRENLTLAAGKKSRDKAFFQNIPLAARSKNVAVEAVKTEASLAEAPGFGILTNTMKLYMVFIKFSIAALIAYLVDIGTFYLFQKLFSALDDEFKILVSTVLSRILCSIATYLLNKGAVFNSNAKSAGTAVRFVILAAIQLVASWLLVWGIGSLLGGGDEINTILKVVVDLVIFLASFTIQRDWVFKESKGVLK